MRSRINGRLTCCCSYTDSNLTRELFRFSKIEYHFNKKNFDIYREFNPVNSTLLYNTFFTSLHGSYIGLVLNAVIRYVDTIIVRFKYVIVDSTLMGSCLALFLLLMWLGLLRSRTTYHINSIFNIFTQDVSK